LKNRLSNLITEFQENTTQSGFRFKIRKLKLLFHSTVDEKTKNFLGVFNNVKKMKMMMKKNFTLPLYREAHTRTHKQTMDQKTLTRS